MVKFDFINLLTFRLLVDPEGLTTIVGGLVIEGVEVDAVAIAVGEDLCACKTRTILPGAC